MPVERSKKPFRVFEQRSRRPDGATIRAGATAERILVNALMGKVPDFFPTIEKKLHANAFAGDVLLLQHRRERQPLPELLLPLRFIFNNSYGQRAQLTGNHYLAAGGLERKRKWFTLTNFG